MQKFIVRVFVFTLLFMISLYSGNLETVQTYIENRLHPEQVTEIKHCGFADHLLFQQYYSQLDAQTQSLAKVLLDKPSRDYSYVSPDGHFTFHYNLDGYHAISSTDVSGNGVPDWIDSAAVYFEYAWAIEIDSLGFNPPPDSLGNPVTNYDIYFTNFGYYGLTTFSNDDIAALPGNNYISYIEVDNNFSSGFYTKGLDALKVTAAHEFNHAIQLGYHFRNDLSDVFYMEMLSTWLEDYVYEDVNDYFQYLDRLFANIDYKPFDTYDGWNEYGNSIYLHMLEKQYGPEAPLHIWANIRNASALNCIDTYLKSKSSSFRKSHIDYATWLYFTGERALPDQCFPEGENYPLIEPDDDSETLTEDLASLKLRYIYLFPDASSVYKAGFESEDNAGTFNHVPNGSDFLEAVSFGNSQVFYQDGSAALVAILSNPTDEKISGIQYTINEYSADEFPKVFVDVTSDKTLAIFKQVPVGSEIDIYTLNGRKICSLGHKTSDDNVLSWDYKDSNNNRVATGIYLYSVYQKNNTQIGKLAVVR